jgi:hypothetical protein
LSKLFLAKLESLRARAACRCEAVSKKLTKAAHDYLSAEGWSDYHACCWVCCDCSIDRFLEEVSA